jgi:hypothetical protein
MALDIIKGSDREFTLRIVRKSTEEPFDLTGLAGAALALKIPTDADSLELTLTPNANGSKLEIISALGGKIKVTLSDVDSGLLKAADGQNIELTIKEGAGPDFDISIVQFPSAINVKKSYFEA